MTYQAFRTTKTVKNPGFDRRCRYGQDAIAEVPAGTFLAIAPSRDRYDTTPIVILNGKSISGDLRRGLFTHAEPSEPRDAREAMILADIAGLQNADVLVQQMVDLGMITLVDIARAAEALNAKWVAEESA